MALKWRKDKQVFESEQQQVTPGRYDCTMIVSGRELHVEPVDVKFYTFESDIYLLDSE